jgi:hypothetical protein
VTARLASIALAFAVVACGSIEEHQVILGTPSAPLAREVDVYMAGQPVPRPFYEIALLQVMGHGTEADPEDVMKALTKRARSLGCDAVVDVRGSTGLSMGHVYGVCVRYSSGPPPTDAPPAPEHAPPPSDGTPI